MIISILGNLRSGKTYIMTILAYIAIQFAYNNLSVKDMERLINATDEITYNTQEPPLKNDILVMANYKIDVPNFKFFGIDELMDLITKIENGEAYELSNCILCLDEIWSILESRVSGAKVSRLVSYFVLQSGKADVQILYTAQMESLADTRLRSFANVTIRCTKDKKNQKFRYLWASDTGFTKKFSILFEKAKQFYKLYDTKYKIPLASIQIKKKMDQVKAEQKEQDLKDKKLQRKIDKMLEQ